MQVAELRWEIGVIYTLAEVSARGNGRWVDEELTSTTRSRSRLMNWTRQSDRLADQSDLRQRLEEILTGSFQAHHPELSIEIGGCNEFKFFIANINICYQFFDLILKMLLICQRPGKWQIGDNMARVQRYARKCSLSATTILAINHCPFALRVAPQIYCELAIVSR